MAAGGATWRGSRWAARLVPLVVLFSVVACGDANQDTHEGDPSGAGSSGSSPAGGAGAPGAGATAQASGAGGSVVSTAGAPSSSAGAGFGGSSGRPNSDGGAGTTAGAGGVAGTSGQSSAGNSGAAGTGGIIQPSCREATREQVTYTICGGAGLDWAQARAFCQSRGADLLQLASAAEEQWVYDAVTEPGSIWLGANDSAQEGDWRWPDGTAVSAGFSDWTDGQPNDSGGGEDCAVLHSGMGQWNDVACSSTSFDSAPITVVCKP